MNNTSRFVVMYTYMQTNNFISYFRDWFGLASITYIGTYFNDAHAMVLIENW